MTPCARAIWRTSNLVASKRGRGHYLFPLVVSFFPALSDDEYQGLELDGGRRRVLTRQSASSTHRRLGVGPVTVLRFRGPCLVCAESARTRTV